jgi:hypothetical protein
MSSESSNISKGSKKSKGSNKSITKKSVNGYDDVKQRLINRDQLDAEFLQK